MSAQTLSAQQPEREGDAMQWSKAVPARPGPCRSASAARMHGARGQRPAARQSAAARCPSARAPAPRPPGTRPALRPLEHAGNQSPDWSRSQVGRGSSETKPTLPVRLPRERAKTPLPGHARRPPSIDCGGQVEGQESATSASGRASRYCTAWRQDAATGGQPGPPALQLATRTRSHMSTCAPRHA